MSAGTSFSMALATASKLSPAITHWPMWETSKRPAFSRVQLCSAMMPVGYCTGM